MGTTTPSVGHAGLRLLLALADGERHGYALMQELRSDGLGAALGPGSLYRNIQQLVTARLITESSGASSDVDDERRRYYRLTPLGRRALAAEANRLSKLLRRAETKGIVAPARR